MANELNYKKDVLNVNANLREFHNTLGGARAFILNSVSEGKIDVPSVFVKTLRESKKDKELYERMNAEVRRSKSGKVSPFYVLQWLYKNSK